MLNVVPVAPPICANVLQLTPWHCAECTDEQLGFYQHQMVQVLRSPHEANGKLICGSIWWACARCLKPVYLVREFGEKR